MFQLIAALLSLLLFVMIQQAMQKDTVLMKVSSNFNIIFVIPRFLLLQVENLTLSGWLPDHGYVTT